MRWSVFALVFALLTSASAGIVEDVIGALNRNSFQAADSDLRAYRAQNGVTPEYIEAYSWMARAALIARDYDQAAAYAKETKTLALEQLKHRPLDAEPHLATALGAAIEVQAQTLEARGQRAQAVAVLRDRATDLPQHLHPGTAAEKPELAVVRGTASAAASNRAIHGIETAVAGAAQGLARAALFLGALVRGL